VLSEYLDVRNIVPLFYATWAASAKIHVTKEIYGAAGVYQASERRCKIV
jgi:hypothetical protein